MIAMNNLIGQFRVLLHRYPAYSAIALGAMILTIVEIYAHSYYRSSLQTYDSARADWSWVSTHKSALAGLKQAAATQQNKSVAALTGLINKTLQQHGLQAARLVPQQNGQIGLWFDGADADVLLKWIFESEQTGRLRIGEVSMSRLGKPGRVSARLTVGYR